MVCVGLVPFGCVFVFVCVRIFCLLLFYGLVVLLFVVRIYWCVFVLLFVCCVDCFVRVRLFVVFCCIVLCLVDFVVVLF